MDGEALVRWESLEDLRPFLRSWIARRCRDDNDVDDVVQETLLRAARYRSSLTSRQNLRAWTVRIAANVLADCVRRDWRLKRSSGEGWVLDEFEAERAERVEEREGDGALFHVAGQDVDCEEALGHLDAALATLRPKDREVLRSYYDGRQSCRETAAECRIPVSLVKVRLFRARARARRALRRRLALAGPRFAPRMGA